MLPLFNTKLRELALLQTQWKSQLDPLISNPVNNNLILKNITLIAGTTNVNHMLGRPLVGWKIVRQRAAASIYDAQDSNKTPDATLTLISSALCVCDIEVF